MSMVIEDYERLSGITGKMREAADAGQWDQLIELEQRCAAEVAAIKPRDVVPADEAARKRKADLIRKMLADDKAIRDKVDPWMQQLEKIMRSSASEKRLQQSYLAQV
jgi:flagellar protein FliT